MTSILSCSLESRWCLHYGYFLFRLLYSYKLLKRLWELGVLDLEGVLFVIILRRMGREILILLPFGGISCSSSYASLSFMGNQWKRNITHVSNLLMLLMMIELSINGKILTNWDYFRYRLEVIVVKL